MIFKDVRTGNFFWLALSFRFFNGKVTFVENPLAGFLSERRKIICCTRPKVDRDL